MKSNPDDSHHSFLCFQAWLLHWSDRPPAPLLSENNWTIELLLYSRQNSTPVSCITIRIWELKPLLQFPLESKNVTSKVKLWVKHTRYIFFGQCLSHVFISSDEKYFFQIGRFFFHLKSQADSLYLGSKNSTSSSFSIWWSTMVDKCGGVKVTEITKIIVFDLQACVSIGSATPLMLTELTRHKLRLSHRPDN